jgi:putative ABC transport system permease protein
MFRNYFSAASNNLRQNKLFSLINITGLSVGLAACILILLYVQNESSYDRHWTDADQIYRVNMTFDLPGRAPWRVSRVPALLLPAFEEYFAEDIEAAGRARPVAAEYRIGDKVFSETVVAIDPEFTELFAFDQVRGNLDNAVASPTGIALSAALALRLFGSVDVVGQTLTLTYLRATTDYTVSSVYRMPEGNTVLELPAMIYFDDAREGDPEIRSWTLSPVATWFKLKQGVDIEALRSRIPAFTDQYVDVSAARAGPTYKPSDLVHYDLENIRDIYLDPNFENLETAGNRTTVQAFSVIAALILIVASINFTILSTARASQRAAGVAVRKMAGATRRQLLGQYLGESFFLVFVSLLAGLMLVELALPVFEAFLGLSLDFAYGAPGTWLALSLLLLMTGFIGGLYPAVILSSFSPAHIFTAGKSPATRDSLSLRNALVVFQFGISIALMIATAIIYLQVQFISTRDPGFNKGNVVIIDGLYAREEVSRQRETFKQVVAALPDVSSVSLSSYHPAATTALSRVSSAFALRGEAGGSGIFATAFIDENFFRTYEIGFVAGRDYTLERDRVAQTSMPGLPEADTSPGTLIVNESTVRQLGFASPQDALGRVLEVPSDSPDGNLGYTIIGVVKDSQFYSLRAEARPELYFLQPSFSDVLTVRYRGSSEAIMTELTAAWRSVMGDAELSARFLEQHVATEFAQETREGTMFVGFSLFSIFIAWLGLYGSAFYTVARKTKAIGIRKVMGAEVREIVTLLLWQFSKPVLLANVVAWPLALWAMLTWLQRFPFRIDSLLLVPLCALAGAVALSIAWLTVAGNAVRVASTNPVYALRYE